MKRLLGFQEMFFASGLNPDEAPFIIERLRGTPLRVRHIVESAPTERVVFQPKDEWSIPEHLNHLTAVDVEFTGRIRQYLERAETMEVGPAGDIPADTEDELTRAPVPELLSAFDRARSDLLELLEGLDEDAFTHAIYFPYLNREVSLVDKLFFIAQHDDSHVAWLWRLSQGSIA